MLFVELLVLVVALIVALVVAVVFVDGALSLTSMTAGDLLVDEVVKVLVLVVLEITDVPFVGTMIVVLEVVIVYNPGF